MPDYKLTIKVEWAPSRNVLAKLSVCPACRKPNVSVKNNWQTFHHLRHGSAGREICNGPSADWLFECALSSAGLGVRSDTKTP